MKEINVAFISKKLKREFDLLEEGKFQDKELYKFIDRAIDDLKEEPTVGIKIRKKIGQKCISKNIRLLICGNMIFLMVGILLCDFTCLNFSIL